MQRLMVFLGHPVYGLSVVLFTILLFGGLGSVTGRPAGASTWRGRRQGGRPAGDARGRGAVDASRHHLDAIGSDRYPHSDVCAAAGAARILHGNDVSARAQHLAPSHGAASVLLERQRNCTSMLASVLGVALSIKFGIANTYALGACCYAVCALMVIGTRQGSHAPARQPRGRSRRRSRSARIKSPPPMPSHLQRDRPEQAVCYAAAERLAGVAADALDTRRESRSERCGVRCSPKPELLEQGDGIGLDDGLRRLVRIQRQQDRDQAAHDVRIAVADIVQDLGAGVVPAQCPGKPHRLAHPCTLFSAEWSASFMGASVRPSSITYRYQVVPLVKRKIVLDLVDRHASRLVCPRLI